MHMYIWCVGRCTRVPLQDCRPENLNKIEIASPYEAFRACEADAGFPAHVPGAMKECDCCLIEPS